ncbi:MAG: VOC family protein [Actinomycetota bacterium]|nr:VOC family protein [Actinomycetota bacterium]
MSIADGSRPRRLHHHAYVVVDQERTRQFYEDIVGLPLVDTWCEAADDSDFCHTFYEMADGSCLAFFQFADPDVQKANTAAPSSVYDHVALDATIEVQGAIAARADAADVFNVTIDHGYCSSLYLADPDGLLIEITVDDSEAVAAAPTRRSQAHHQLSRWLAGDHKDNNTYRRH